ELPCRHGRHVETWHWLAEHGPRARGLAWRRGAERDVKRLAGDKLAIGDAFRAIGSRADDAIRDGQLLHRHGEPRGSELEQRGTGGRRGLCQVTGIEIARRRLTAH